jgi:hypothetical protein
LSSNATFSERIDALRTMTGRGQKVTASCAVDQVYAHAQHEHLDWHHPRGGRAKYLEGPLMDRYRDYLTRYAAGVLSDGGMRAMQGNAEDLADQVELNAPVEFSDLRRSGHPKVTVGERTVYDRAPKVPRLTEEDLRLKSRLRWASLPDALKGWIYWHMTARGKAGLPPERGGHL